MNIKNARDCLYFNNHYYVIKDKNNIEEYDNKQNFINSFNVEKNFNSITFYEEEQCFYLSAFKENKALYKSNDLKNYEKINLNLSLNCHDEIIHINYCEFLKGILITTKKKIILYDLLGCFSKILFEVKEECTKLNDCTQPLGCNHNLNIILISAICCCKKIIIAYRKGNISYLAELRNHKLGEILYETKDIIESMCIINHQIWLLVYDGCRYKLVNTHIDCKCKCFSCCENDIIESIALIETGLAHIVNAEGEKIQKALELSDNIDDLICVNSSVQDTIYYITVLEFILSEKLKTVKKDHKECN